MEFYHTGTGFALFSVSPIIDDFKWLKLSTIFKRYAMPQVNLPSIESMVSLDNKGIQAESVATGTESGRRFGDELGRQLAAEDSGNNQNTSANKKLKEEKTSDLETSQAKNSSDNKTKETSDEYSDNSKNIIEEPSSEITELKSESKAVDEEHSDLSDGENTAAYTKDAHNKLNEEAVVIHNSSQKVETDQSHELISFLSAAAKLLPEDTVISDTAIAGNDENLRLTPLDKFVLSQLDTKNTTVENALIKQKKIDLQSTQQTNAALLTKDIEVDELAIEELNELVDLLKNVGLIEGSKSAISLTELKNELKQLSQTLKLSPEQISQAKDLIEKFVQTAEGEVSLEDLNIALNKDPVALSNPIIRQILKTESTFAMEQVHKTKAERLQENSSHLQSGLADESKDQLNLANEAKLINDLEIKSIPVEQKNIDASKASLENVNGQKKIELDNSSQVQKIENGLPNHSQETQALHASESVIKEASSKVSGAEVIKNTLGTASVTNITQTSSTKLSSESNTNNATNSENLEAETLLHMESEAKESDALLSPQKTTSQVGIEKPVISRLDSQVSQVSQVVDEGSRSDESLDTLLNMIQSDTNIQSPKTLTPVQNEIISIYRKDFSDAVKEKVMVMINQKIQQVDIQLDPPELGNVHVRVNLQNEQASVSFTVQNQQAKDALDQNMGKLKDMLSQSGVDVGDASVNQQSKKQQEGEANSSQGRGLSDEQLGTDDGLSQVNVLNMVKDSSVGIDYYA